VKLTATVGLIVYIKYMSRTGIFKFDKTMYTKEIFKTIVSIKMEI